MSENGNGNGGRKLKAQREALITLLIGTSALALMHADAATHAGFVTGVVGIASGFMWGNAKEHQAQSQTNGN